MKTPGTRVALVVPDSQVAVLGTLIQPVLFDGDRRWSVEWHDGFPDDPSRTWPEDWLLEVMPQ